MGGFLLLRTFFHGAAQQCQCRRDAQHGRDQEVAAAENDQADQRNTQPHQRGGVVLAGAPLLHHDHKEQRGHRKVDACGIKGDDAAQQRAGHAARHPINLVEQRSKQIVTVLVHALGHIAAAYYRIRLVGEGKNQVRLCCAGVFIALQHRNTVKQVAGTKSFTILIDPGHGGFDPGKVSPDGIMEKDINLAIASKLASALTDQGFSVYLTRDSDKSLNSENASSKKTSDLKARTNLATNVNADLYISIHQNSYSAEYVHGAQVFYYSTSSGGKALAECIQEHLISEADPSNTRAAKGNSEYLVLRESPCTAVIVECGFLSNTKECSDLCNDEYQTALANAICNAVCTWHEQHAK